mmetsp:Transcript_3855/g.4443  ORF Transcript_3855/g.4443 Transcript_3855/m.4443 type:complete len:170 (+) Transcript_3855:129-638(+)
MEVEQAQAVPMDRDAWVFHMRKEFCPEEMVEENGDLNQDYFQPKSTDDESLKWNEEDDKRLRAGIQKFGIGMWDGIKTEFLPIWDEIAIRIRTYHMMGTQDLSKYENWKGDEKAIEAEREKNIEAAKKEGAFAFGVQVKKEFGNLEVKEKENESKKTNQKGKAKDKKSK